MLFKSRRCVAPPRPAAMTAIGPRNTMLTTHMRRAHLNSRPKETDGNQSCQKPSAARLPIGRGVRRGLFTNARNWRTSWRNLGRSGTVALMQPAHGLLEHSIEQQGHDTAGAHDTVFNTRQLFTPRRIQYKGRHLLSQTESARMPDTEAQAPERGARESRLNVAQPVVPRMAATLLEFDLTGQKIEFVVQHQYLFRLELVETHQGTGRLAGTVHECDGLRDDDRLATMTALGHPGEEVLLEREGGAEGIGNGSGQPETGVMTRGCVFGGRLAPADDESDGGCCGHESLCETHAPE